MIAGASGVEKPFEPGWGKAAGLRGFSDPIAKALEVGGIEIAQALVFLSGHDDGNIAVLAPDHDWFALGRIEESGEALFRVCG